MTKSIAINIPEKSGYGAAELKLFNKKYTYRAFLYTISLALMLILLSFYVDEISNKTLVAPQVVSKPVKKIFLTDIPAPAKATPIQQQAQKSGGKSATTSTATIAKTGIPVPTISPEIKTNIDDILNQIDKVNIGGIGSGHPEINAGGNPDGTYGEKKYTQSNAVEPGQEDFIAVEQEPQIDLVKLNKNLVYPEMARLVGVEGQVILRVLVGKDGMVKKAIVQHSDNSLLDKAALDAINKYGYITPAIQNKQPVQFWLNIPIKFRLR